VLDSRNIHVVTFCCEQLAHALGRFDLVDSQRHLLDCRYPIACVNYTLTFCFLLCLISLMDSSSSTFRGKARKRYSSFGNLAKRQWRSCFVNRKDAQARDQIQWSAQIIVDFMVFFARRNFLRNLRSFRRNNFLNLVMYVSPIK
jgi:hypothetical protein